MKKADSADNVKTREASFHDKWATATPVEKILCRDSFESIAAQENRFIMALINRKLGGLKNKKVLDLGCGLGESSVYFALQGAAVTATDISSEMVARCLKLSEYHGVRDRVRGVVISAEEILLPEGNYDIIYAANLFHHVQDLEGVLMNLKKYLRLGGMFFSWDPVAYNPLINIYRKMATEVRTEDEHPLKAADIRTMRRVFPDLCHREFWFSTLALFIKYYLVDRLDPNACRYWKRILLETDKTIGWWFRPLLTLDGLLRRVPGVKWLAWNTVVWASKDDDI